MKVFYHSADLDGWCSGAILKHKYPHIELYPIDYNDSIPTDVIHDEEEVYICDFSFPPDIMNELNDRCLLRWIDHHESAIEKNSRLHIPGLRRTDQSGCYLTWEYVMQSEVPICIRSLSDYDNHNFTMKKMVLELNETLQFQYGMRARMNDPKSSFLCWREFFNVADDYEFYIETCGIGYYVLKYQSELNKSILRKYAKEIEWEGYSCLVCNTQNFINNTFMLNEYDRYELKIVYSIDMDGKYCVNIYSTNPEIDCSKIAVKYGGGGHVGSAGFITNELPF